LAVLLLAPHAAIGLAWVFWFRSPPRSEAPKWQNVVLFLGLVSGSLNIVAFWGYVFWLQNHNTISAWRVRDLVFAVCEYLIGATIVGGSFGRGRVRVTVCVAGILGFFLWVTTAVGVL